jgi:riboflavin kinase / FMN adenylyltransferase
MSEHHGSGLRVLDGRAPAPPELRGEAIALGVLDGVHLGHQGVLAAARARSATFAAAVFEPHPRHFFQTSAPPFRLQNAAQRARAIAATGANAVFQIPFDAHTAALTDEAFARDVLAGAIGASYVCVGADFRFGHNRAGDAEALTRYGARFGFGVTVVPAILADGVRVSSTAIRALIGEGRVKDAARLLSRPFAIEREVIHGAARGRTIGFPTANIALGDYAPPKFGVYAVRTRIDGVEIAGVANCGVKPTVSDVPAPLLEAHLFDYAGDLYGRTIEIALIDFLRPEQKFASFDALKAQIAQDAAAARAALA